MTARLTVGAVAGASVLVVVALLAAFGAGGQDAHAGIVLTPTATPTATSTPTSTPTATATSTSTSVSTATATATPLATVASTATATSTTAAQAPSGLPPTGSESPGGSGFAWTVAAALAVGGLALAVGGAVFWKRAR